jgi:hypothetical protein
MKKSAAKHGAWLHFIDSTGTSVQTKDSVAHIESYWNQKARVDGFTAYMLNSVLAKLQIERMRDNPKKGFFTDSGLAMTWLLTQVGADPALQGKTQ